MKVTETGMIQHMTMIANASLTNQENNCDSLNIFENISRTGGLHDNVIDSLVDTRIFSFTKKKPIK